MTTDTKSLFVSLIKKLQCDLILDIGSRDGKQSLLFKDALPSAKVVAFEANPLNYRKMCANETLKGRIEFFPWAVSDSNGKATFHIADAAYDAPETVENNLGTSSLLVHPGLKSSKSVEVETIRLDTLLQREVYARYKRIALWIDAESAEYFILDGMKAVADRVQLIHVETARSPMRLGQRTYSEVSQLLSSLDFKQIGSNLTPNDNWGDIVVIKSSLLDLTRSAKVKALATKTFQFSHVAVFLKGHCPFLYRVLRAAVVKGL